MGFAYTQKVRFTLQHHQIATDSLTRPTAWRICAIVFDRSEAIGHLQGRERGVPELLGGCTLSVRELLKGVGTLAHR
jgi:hypothetical protein